MWFPDLKNEKKKLGLDSRIQAGSISQSIVCCQPRGSEPQRSLFGQTPIAPSQTLSPASLLSSSHAVTLGGHIVGVVPGVRRRRIPGMAIGSAGAGTPNRSLSCTSPPHSDKQSKTMTYVTQHQRAERERGGEECQRTRQW